MKTIKLLLLSTIIIFMSCSSDSEDIKTSKLTLNNNDYALTKGFVNQVNYTAKSNSASSKFHFFLTNGTLTNSGDSCKYSNETSHVLSFILPQETGTFTDINAVFHSDFKINGNNCNNFNNTVNLGFNSITVTKNGDNYTIELSGFGNGYFTGKLNPTTVTSLVGI